MASTQDYETEWDNSRFPREKNTGVIMGLDWPQVIFLAVAGIALTVIIVFSLGFPVGVIVGILNLVVAGMIGIPRFWGRSLIGWALAGIRFLFRGAADQLRYQRPLPVVTTSVDRHERSESEGTQEGRDKHGRIIPGPGYRLNLPGEHAELKIFDLPGGAGFVFDPKRKEGIVVARLLAHRALDLESDENLEDRITGFRDSITALSGVKGINRVQLTDQTTMISGSRVESWYDYKRAQAPRITDPDTGAEVPLSGERINAFGHQSYKDMVAAASDQPVNEAWITIVLDAHKLERRSLAAGGGLRGFMEACLGVMHTVEQIVPASGVSVAGWHSPRSMGALARSAFDPTSALEISDRDDEWAGAAPESAGPAGARVGMNHFWSDGWFHRTLMISEWPQRQANIGFMEKLVFAGSFRHTVTVVFKPKDLRSSLQKTQGRKADWNTASKIRQRLDRPESMEHALEYEDIENEESELMDGHAAVDIVALVTVSGKDEQELEANTDDIRAKAAQANCELRPAVLQQDSAFVAAALPFGRTVLT